MEETGVAPEYDMSLQERYACMGGVAGLGVIIEVVGREEKRIRANDLRAISKILEFCEKEGCKIGHHSWNNTISYDVCSFQDMHSTRKYLQRTLWFLRVTFVLLV